MKKETLNKQIDRLSLEFADKGFNMPKERMLQWYERFKDTEDKDFTAAIDIVLDTCSFAPAMADLVKSLAQVKEQKSHRELKRFEG